MTDTTTRTLHCVLIPINNRQLLLPNVSIAEVVDYNTRLSGNDEQDWLAGYLEWRGQTLPVISYEGANEQDAVIPDTGRGRIVVLNTIGSNHEKLPFLAIVTQGIPSQTRLEPEQIHGREDSEQGPADLMQVDLEGEPVWIPNLEYLENLGIEALKNT